MRRACLILLAFFLLESSAGATTVYPFTMDELIQHADIIVLGQVLALKGALSKNKLILTRVTVKVDQCFKGTPSRQIIVRHLGGVYQGKIQRPLGAPVFKVGETVFLFLKKSKTGDEYITMSLKLCKFSYVKDKQNRVYLKREVTGLGFSKKPEWTGDIHEFDFSVIKQQIRALKSLTPKPGE